MIIVENKEIIIEMSQRGPTGKRGPKGDKGDPGTTSWYDLEDRPTLGALADHDTVNYETEIDNLPTLGALADHDTIDYNTEIDNLPTLGDLAAKDKVDYENDIDNLPTLGDLAAKDKVDYENDIDNLPTLGTMSEVDDAPSDSKEYARKDGEWVRVTDNAAAWGKIIGNIANQTDLNSELMGKAAVDHVHGNLNTAGEVTGGSYAITNGDRMLISDASHDNRLRSSNVIFDGSSIGKGLTQKGTFESFAVPEMLSDSEESMTATRDYVEGDLIAVGRYLYVALSNIASGTTLVQGSNVAITTFEEQVYTKSETDNLLSAKADSADLGDLAAKDKVDWDTDIDDIPETFPPAPHNHDDRYYTEDETDNLLAGKQPTLTFDNTPTANSTNPVTSGGVKTALDAKANSADVYTKTQANGLLDAKANSADVYSKTDADELLDEKLDTDADETLTGDILTFDAAVTNAIKDLTIDIEPVQDLHGYDAPWPSGGGKNLYDYESPNSSGNGLTISLSDVGIFTISGIPTSNYVQIVPSKEIINLLEDGASYTISATSYNTNFFLQVVATKPDNSKSYYDTKSNKTTFTVNKGTYNSYKINITTNTMANWGESSKTLSAGFMLEQGSTATSFAPYSNVCPISGHTSATVTRTGKNLMKLSSALVDNSQNISVTYTDTGITATATANYARAMYHFKVIPNKTYTLHFDAVPISGAYNRILLDDKNTWVYPHAYSFLDGQTSNTFTFTPTKEDVYLGFYITSSQSSGTYTATNIQLELGSSATAYEPYTPQTVTIDLDGTRYGGSINVLTGEMTVDRAYYEPTSPTQMGSTYGTEKRAIFTTPSNIKSINASTVNPLLICSMYKTLSANQTYSRTVGISDTNGLVGCYIYDPNLQTVEAWETFLSSNPVQIVYPLATPLTVQLTAEQVSTLIGQNVLLSDTGSSTAVIRTGAGRFAYQDSIDYDSDYLTNKPDLAQKADIIKSSASGSLVHLTDAGAYPVDALTVGIEPVQDLHGYDAPWPAGGGKNLLDVSSAIGTESGVTFTRNANGSITVSGSSASSLYRLANSNLVLSPSTNYSVNGMQANIKLRFRLYDSNNSQTRELYATNVDLDFTTSASEVKADVYIIVTTGTTGTIYPMLRLSSVTDATFAPYSNICPISGHSTAVVTRTGRNLLPMKDDSYTTMAHITFTTTASGSLSFSGTASETTSYMIAEFQIPAGAYKLSGLSDGSSSTYRLRIRDKNNTNNAVLQWTGDATITLSSNTTVQVQAFVYSGATVNKTVYPMLRLASDTDASYDSPRVQSLTINLDGTRYGGTLNVLTGEMTVDRKYVALSDSSQIVNYSTSAQYGSYGAVATDGLIDLAHANVISSMLKPTTFNLRVSEPNTDRCYIDDSGKVVLRASASVSITSANDLFARFSGAQFVYLLATPLTVQLTPSQLTTLLGENNIWSDTGQTSVGYRADTKLYIDQKIAASALATRSLITAVTTAMVAPKNLVANDLLIVNDDLIKITANVNNGGTLTLGTNCSKLTLAEYILSVIS